MDSKRLRLPTLLAAALVLSLAPGSRAEEIKRIPFTKEEAAQPDNSAYAAKLVQVNNWVFPSGIYGTKPNPLEQVDEVIEKMNARLAEVGLSFGDLRQVTWFVKEGAVEPVSVLNRSGEAVARLGIKRSGGGVGTIIRLPSMPGNSMVMLDLVAGAPLAKGADGDGYKRYTNPYGPFKGGMTEIVAGNQILFTAGFEAMDFKNNYKIPATLDEQVAAVVAKLDNAFKRAGLSLANMIQHNIYYKVGLDPAAIVKKFHEEINKREPLHKQFPGVGAMMAVNGMAHPAFMLEVDAVGTTAKPEEVKSVPFTEIPMDVNKTATAGGLTFIVDVVGVEYANNLKYPDRLDAQIELSVKNLRDMMKKAGLDLANLVKIRLMVKKGASDADKVRAKFYQVLTGLAPKLKTQPAAETLMFVEKLDRELAFQIVAIAAK